MTDYHATPDFAAFVPHGKAPLVVTRFAPSPNGALHIGHAYAIIAAHDFAKASGGTFLLRIEDIDGTRSRADHIEAILADLAWLGIGWDYDVVYQSARIKSYHAALERLRDMGLLYRCTCTRSDILRALKTQPVIHGPDGPHYPGTCRGKDIDAMSGRFCWRIDMQAALKPLGPLIWHDLQAGDIVAEPAQFGDVVLWRKDAPASYHLAATLDDDAMGISHVVRGLDLFAYTALHRLLQALLDLPVPQYWHHPLLLDSQGHKLAKSRASPALSDRRLAGEDGKLLKMQLRRGILPLGITLSSA
jgi:glutamyl-Q tRNA(Asp) synthetase